jgi:hypothetical protein
MTFPHASQINCSRGFNIASDRLQRFYIEVPVGSIGFYFFVALSFWVRSPRFDQRDRSAQPDRNDAHLADEFHRRRLDREQFLLGVVDKAVSAARLRTAGGRLADDQIVLLLNARTDRASQHDNHCFRLRQPVSLAIVKRVP